MSTRKLLLTGAAGFLGRAVAHAFLQQGWEVHGLDAAPAAKAPPGITYEQVTLPGPELEQAISGLRPEACVHAAGRASVALSRQQPEADFHDGVVLTFALLNALRLHAPACRTVLLSSAAVYGNPTSLPITEEHPPAPLSPYGFHKLQCEMVALEFSRVYGLPVASARIFSAYGAGLRRQVVWDICEQAIRQGSLRLRGTGGESRDFVHAADVASALLAMAEAAPMQAECYNVGSGEETAIADLADRLLQHLGLPGPAQFGAADNPDDPRNWCAGIDRLRALGFAPRVPLDEGLREVAAWARAELGAAS